MKTDIKCAECGKGTLKFELGEIYYDRDMEDHDILVKESIICPKCKTDISDGKCIVKTRYLMISLIAANICRSMRESIPEHLRGSHPLRREEFERMRCTAKGRLMREERKR